MKLLKRVSSLKLKRVFVAAQKIRLARRKGSVYLPELKKSEFLVRLNAAKKLVDNLAESQLDKIIANDGGIKRLKAYNSSNWHIAKASIDELGVWRRAGGLPSRWTSGALAETASFVKKGLSKNSKRIRARSKRAIPRIMEFSKIIISDEYLYPIVFEGGTGTKGRAWYRKRLVGDIDDGSMRAIALSLSGYKTLNIYFGRPKASTKPKLV